MDPALYAPITKLSLAPVVGLLLVLVPVLGNGWPHPTFVLSVNLRQPAAPGENAQLAHLITITESGDVEWDGRRLSTRSLVNELEQVRDLDPQPALIFEPGPDAPYGASAKVLNIIIASGATGAGLCFGGLPRHRDFGGAPYTPFRSSNAHRTIPPRPYIPDCASRFGKRSPKFDSEL